MANSQTSNYQLNQWAASDRILREEFNADNQKLDAALAGVQASVPQIIAGSYVGDGAAARTISLGATPRALILFPDRGEGYHSEYPSTRLCGGLVLPGKPLQYSNANGTLVAAKIVDGGFQVFTASLDLGASAFASSATNSTGGVYHYLAIA